MSDPERQIGKIKYQRMHQYLLIDVVLMTLLVIKHVAKKALGFTMLSNSGTSEDLNFKASRHANMRQIPTSYE